MATDRPPRPEPAPEKKQKLEALLEDLRSGHLQHTLRQDLKETYHFYLDDASRDELSAMGQVKRFLTAGWWLLKSLFFKLTPLRRLMLVASLFLVLNGTGGDTGFLYAGFLVLLLTLALELKDKLLAQDELASGRDVQLALMPEGNPALPGWETWLFTRPANDVGGDLVDYLERDGGRLGLALGDVAGKGLPAALLMARLQATIRALAPAHTDLADLGRTLNYIFRRDGLSNRFASLVYLELNAHDGHVRVLNAGHFPPLVIRRDSIEEMARGATAIGLMADPPYVEQHVDLAPGDLLVVYSDGVTEARNAYGWFFDEDRLHTLLPGLRGLTAEAAGKAILAAVDGFTGPARPSDDLSLIVLRRLPPPLSATSDPD